MTLSNRSKNEDKSAKIQLKCQFAIQLLIIEKFVMHPQML